MRGRRPRRTAPGSVIVRGPVINKTPNMISPIRKPTNCDAHICWRYIKLIIVVTSPSPEMEFYARLYLRQLSVRSRAVACYHTVQARMTEYLLLTSAQFAEYYDFPVIYGDYLQGVASPRFSHPNSISPSALILLEFMQYKFNTTVAHRWHQP